MKLDTMTNHRHPLNKHLLYLFVDPAAAAVGSKVLALMNFMVTPSRLLMAGVLVFSSRLSLVFSEPAFAFSGADMRGRAAARTAGTVGLEEGALSITGVSSCARSKENAAPVAGLFRSNSDMKADKLQGGE